MFGGPAPAPGAFKAYPFMLYLPDFTPDGRTHIIALHSCSTDWLGDVSQSFSSHGMGSGRRSDSQLLTLVIPPPLTEAIDTWSVQDVSTFMRANGPFTEEFIAAVAAQHMDGISMLSNGMLDRRFKKHPYGLVVRLTQTMQALRLRFDRRCVTRGLFLYPSLHRFVHSR